MERIYLSHYQLLPMVKVHWNIFLSQRCPSRRGSGRFFKIHRGSGAAAVDFLKIYRGSGSIFFEDIEKVHEFDRVLVFTSETS
jgi:hypothetical protein